MKDSDASQAHVVSRLMLIFAFVYVAEGWGGTRGVIEQPLIMMLRDGAHWTTDQISGFQWWLQLPWLFKPIIGMFCDCVPLAGYRRKSYLWLGSAGAVALYVYVSTLMVPEDMRLPMTAITTMMALMSTICGALIVEYGRGAKVVSDFVGQQALWANIGAVAAMLMGGLLCAYFAPTAALHVAEYLALIAPAVVACTVWSMVKDQKRKADWTQAKSGCKAIGGALITPALWSVVGFLFLWALNPGFLTPLTIYMKETLAFKPPIIGLMRALQAGGALVGALIYMRFLTHRYSVKRLAVCLILAGAATQFAYLLMSGAVSAGALFFLWGAVSSAVSINAHAVAARRCPDGAEGTVYAALLAVTSIGWTSSDWVGSYFFEHYLHQTLTWLIVASAMLTLSCLLIVWKFDFDKTGDR